MIASKDEERIAITKIQKIITGLGPDSYVGKAIEGCLELAEKNVEEDAFFSMKDRYEAACSQVCLLKKQVHSLEKDLECLQKESEIMKQELEKEQEWKPYPKTGNMETEEFQRLFYDDISQELLWDDAVRIIAEEFGFQKEMICILTELPVYEINRHKALRQTGTVFRGPVYAASDWNYILFQVKGQEYECINGELYLL